MNYCTEEEAKTKWCPFARGAVKINGMAAVGNRFIEGEDGNAARQHMSCLGSACMAWTEWERLGEGGKFVPTGRGYCGMATTP